VSTAPSGLGLVTIMDRDLALRLGAPYVKLAAFAIDLYRLRVMFDEIGDDEHWPFGWEVLLTERALLRALPTTGDDDVIDFVDAICTSIFERAAEGEILGAQIVFSAYAAFERGALPAKVRPTFFHWKKKPTELVAAVRKIESDPGNVAALIDQCLAEELDPPLAPTTHAELEALRT